jgi:hypothetical protein
LLSARPLVLLQQDGNRHNEYRICWIRHTVDGGRILGGGSKCALLARLVALEGIDDIGDAYSANDNGDAHIASDNGDAYSANDIGDA